MIYRADGLPIVRASSCCGSNNFGNINPYVQISFAGMKVCTIYEFQFLANRLCCLEATVFPSLYLSTCSFFPINLIDDTLLFSFVILLSFCEAEFYILRTHARSCDCIKAHRSLIQFLFSSLHRLRHESRSTLMNLVLMKKSYSKKCFLLYPTVSESL